MEINKYKHFNVQTLQSQIQDSVESKETHMETQGQANHKSRIASGPGFAAPDPSTGPETPTEEILPNNHMVTMVHWQKLQQQKQEQQHQEQMRIKTTPMMNMNM